MILFDLACSGGHKFEAWFNNSSGYDDQHARGLIACPVCGDSKVDKALMAPRLAAKGNQRDGTPPPTALATSAPPPTGSDIAVTNGGLTGGDGPSEAAMRAVMAAIAAKQAELLPRSRWVGRDFAPAARAMHEGRADTEIIHGSVSPQEAADLHADGVAALPLLVPFVPPEQAN